MIIIPVFLIFDVNRDALIKILKERQESMMLITVPGFFDTVHA